MVGDAEARGKMCVAFDWCAVSVQVGDPVLCAHRAGRNPSFDKKGGKIKKEKLREIPSFGWCLFIVSIVATRVRGGLPGTATDKEGHGR